MGPLAKALIAANVHRILWGTDWPHPDTAAGKPPTEISPLRQIDDGRLFDQFCDVGREGRGAEGHPRRESAAAFMDSEEAD